MSNPYKLERADLDSQWDEFVQASPDGTIFSSSVYLQSISESVAAYYCYKNREIKAAISLIESCDRSSTMIHDFVIYNGLMFAPPGKDQNRATVGSDRFRLATFVAEELADRYEEVRMSLAPSIVDIRPFLWYNYGTELPKYETRLLYTSYLAIEDFAQGENPEDIPAFRECSYSRRQEIRYAIRENVVTKEEFEPDLFVNFYKLTMERQGAQVEPSSLEARKALICALLEHQLGRMFISFTADGEPGSMAFFGIDNKCAHYIFGANDPKLRDCHTGTAVLWDAFKVLSRSGVTEVNLEGVNSPHRGWFKLSFGGDLRPYFQLIKKK